MNNFDFQILHDVLLEATGESFVDQAIDNIVAELPNNIKMEIDEWGVSDTLVRELLLDYWSED